MTCPPPNLWVARRECFLVAFENDVDPEDSIRFIPIAMSDLKDGDYFTLEASHEEDLLAGLAATERMFKASGEPYYVDGVCQVDCERV